MPIRTEGGSPVIKGKPHRGHSGGGGGTSRGPGGYGVPSQQTVPSGGHVIHSGGYSPGRGGVRHTHNTIHIPLPSASHLGDTSPHRGHAPSAGHSHLGLNRISSYDAWRNSQAYRRYAAPRIIQANVELDKKGRPIMHKVKLPVIKDPKSYNHDSNLLHKKLVTAHKEGLPQDAIHALNLSGQREIAFKHFVIEKKSKNKVTFKTHEVEQPVYKTSATALQKDLHNMQESAKEIRQGKTFFRKTLGKKPVEPPDPGILGQIGQTINEGLTLGTGGLVGEQGSVVKTGNVQGVENFVEAHTLSPKWLIDHTDSITPAIKVVGKGLKPVLSRMNITVPHGGTGAGYKFNVPGAVVHSPKLRTGLLFTADYGLRPQYLVESAVGHALGGHGADPWQAFLHGQHNKHLITGGDIARYLGVPKQSGLMIDFALDPLMYTGVGGALVRSAEKSAALLSRINKVDEALTRTPELARLTEEAGQTGKWGTLEQELRRIASEHNIDVKWLGKTRADRAAMKDTRQLANQSFKDIIADAKLSKDKAETLLGGAHSAYIPGRPAMRYLEDALRFGNTRELKPGIRIKVGTPVGREVTSLQIPLPRWLPAGPGKAIFRGFRGTERSWKTGLEERNVAAKIRADTQPELDRLQGIVNDLEKRIPKEPGNKQLIQLRNAAQKDVKDFHTLRDLHVSEAQAQAARQNVLWDNLGNVVDRINHRRSVTEFVRASRSIGPALQTRMFHNVIIAVDPIQMDSRAMSRVGLRQHLVHDLGGTGIIDPYYKFTGKELKVAADLDKVYQEFGKFGLDTKVLTDLISAYTPRSFTRAGKVGGELKGIPEEDAYERVAGATKTNPSKNRALFETTSITDRSKMIQILKTLSDKPMSDKVALDIADQLYHIGQVRLLGDLTIQRLIRNGAEGVNFNELTPSEQKAVFYFQHLRVHGKDLPETFKDYEKSDGQLALNQAAEEHQLRNFRVDGLQGLNAEQEVEARLVNVQDNIDSIDTALHNLQPGDTTLSKSYRTSQSGDTQLAKDYKTVKARLEAEKAKLVANRQKLAGIGPEPPPKTKAKANETGKKQAKKNQKEASKPRTSLGQIRKKLGETRVEDGHYTYADGWEVKANDPKLPQGKRRWYVTHDGEAVDDFPTKNAAVKHIDEQKGIGLEPVKQDTTSQEIVDDFEQVRAEVTGEAPRQTSKDLDIATRIEKVRQKVERGELPPEDLTQVLRNAREGKYGEVEVSDGEDIAPAIEEPAPGESQVAADAGDEIHQVVVYRKGGKEGARVHKILKRNLKSREDAEAYIESGQHGHRIRAKNAKKEWIGVRSKKVGDRWTQGPDDTSIRPMPQDVVLKREDMVKYLTEYHKFIQRLTNRIDMLRRAQWKPIYRVMVKDTTTGEVRPLTIASETMSPVFHDSRSAWVQARKLSQREDIQAELGARTTRTEIPYEWQKVNNYHWKTDGYTIRRVKAKGERSEHYVLRRRGKAVGTSKSLAGAQSLHRKLEGAAGFSEAESRASGQLKITVRRDHGAEKARNAGITEELAWSRHNFGIYRKELKHALQIARGRFAKMGQTKVFTEDVVNRMFYKLDPETGAPWSETDARIAAEEDAAAQATPQAIEEPAPTELPAEGERRVSQSGDYAFTKRQQEFTDRWEVLHGNRVVHTFDNEAGADNYLAQIKQEQDYANAPEELKAKHRAEAVAFDQAAEEAKQMGLNGKEQAKYVKARMAEHKAGMEPQKAAIDDLAAMEETQQLGLPLEDAEGVKEIHATDAPTKVIREAPPEHIAGLEEPALQPLASEIGQMSNDEIRNLVPNASEDYIGSLIDFRDTTGLAPILDPRVANFWYTRRLAWVTVHHARWTAIDKVHGRSVSESWDEGKRFKIAGRSKDFNIGDLKIGEQTDDGVVHTYVLRDDPTTHIPASDIQFQPQTLLPIGKTEEGRVSLWMDVHTHREYMSPGRLNDDWANAIEGFVNPTGDAPRVWPTDLIRDLQHEFHRYGEGGQKEMFQQGMDIMLSRAMSYTRLGVTTYFPAFHFRNLISDTLKSLQADSGVLFHPITNIRLASIAMQRGRMMVKIPFKEDPVVIKWGAQKVNIPGIGQMRTEDVLLMMDFLGLRSNQHIAEVAHLADKGTTEEVNTWLGNGFGGFLRRGKYTAKGGFGLGPSRAIGRNIIEFSGRREDITRFVTFTQRLRRNGGDAADAVWYTIKHHFDYGDLTNAERRIMRNLFLFYTWYRKNIPLQFMEVINRPGFFNAVANSYIDLAQGETPLNWDFSKIAPWLPNLEGELPNQALIPGYMLHDLAAASLNWNGHAVAFGYGAPWADMNIVTNLLSHPLGEGGRNLMSMTNPLFSQPFAMITGKDLLTGRDLAAKETSGTASIAQWLVDHTPLNGMPLLSQDTEGHPILPSWLNQAAGIIPIWGRASGYLGKVKNPGEDQGTLNQLFGGGWGTVLTGVNAYVAPGGGERLDLAYLQKVEAWGAQRSDLRRQVGNDKNADKIMHQWDRHILQVAKEQGVPLRYLQAVSTMGPDIYISSEDRSKGKLSLTIGATGLGTSSESNVGLGTSSSSDVLGGLNFDTGPTPDNRSSEQKAYDLLKGIASPAQKKANKDSLLKDIGGVLGQGYNPDVSGYNITGDVSATGTGELTAKAQAHLAQAQRNLEKNKAARAAKSKGYTPVTYKGGQTAAGGRVLQLKANKKQPVKADQAAGSFLDAITHLLSGKDKPSAQELKAQKIKLAKHATIKLAAKLSNLSPSGLDMSVSDAHLIALAAKKNGVLPGDLAAIYHIETSWGDLAGDTSSAGAQGPMQFMPATWASYGNGKSVYNHAAAFDAAARYLKASGYDAKSQQARYNAFLSYNHADWYAQDVLKMGNTFSKPAGLWNKAAKGGLGALGSYLKVKPVKNWAQYKKRYPPGTMVTLKGIQTSGGGDDKVNAAIAPLLTAFFKKYGMKIHQGYGGSSTSSVSLGHTTTGTSTDVAPVNDAWNNPKAYARFKKGIEVLTSLGFVVGYDGSIPGTETWPNHGFANHAHIEWVENSDNYGIAPGARKKLRKLLTHGGKLPIPAVSTSGGTAAAGGGGGGFATGSSGGSGIALPGGGGFSGSSDLLGPAFSAKLAAISSGGGGSSSFSAGLTPTEAQALGGQSVSTQDPVQALVTELENQKKLPFPERVRKPKFNPKV